MKGGEAGRDLSISNVSPNYFPNKELIMAQPSRPVADFKLKTNRTLYGSIYRKEGSSPDFLDSKKLHHAFHK
jgi:hypothetical protein